MPAGSRHLRFDPGGIMDVEFLVALGQLAHAADPGVRVTTTRRRRSRAWSRSAGRSRSRDDYAALRRATLRLRLLLDRPEDVVLARAISRCSPAASERPPTRSARELEMQRMAASAAGFGS